MAVHSYRATWQPHISSMRKGHHHHQSSRSQILDKPLPPPPLFAYNEFDAYDTTGGGLSPRFRSCPNSPIYTAVPAIYSVPVELIKRADSGVAIELEAEFSSFVASSPSIFRESIMGGVSPRSVSDKSIEERRKRRSMGPRLPVKISTPPPMDGGGSGISPPRPLHVQKEVLVSRASSDGSVSDIDLDAPAKPSRRLSSMSSSGHHRQFSFESSVADANNDNKENLGLGIEGAGTLDHKQQDVPAAPELEVEEEKVKLSGRMSGFFTDDPLFNLDGMAAEEPPLPAPPASSESPSHSRQNSRQPVLSTVDEQPQESTPPFGTPQSQSREASPDPPVTTAITAPSPDDSPNKTLHSRQSTAETISAPQRGLHASPSVVSRLSPAEREERDDTEMERPISPISTLEREARPSILANVNSLRERSMSPAREEGRGHVRSETAETIHARPPSSRTSPQLRSVSPGQLSSGRQSPDKLVPGAFGGTPLSSSPPQPTHLRATDRERPAPSPVVAQDGLARKASTSFNSFLSRVGSIRKARSPPGPRPKPEGRASQESRFVERRNTGASMASMDSRQSLATISDSDAVSDDGNSKRHTLQDQFRTARRREEYNFPGMASDTEDEDADAERTPIAARMSRDTFDERPTSPTKTKDRSSSIPVSMKSPPLNPSLPPGTASGITAGPAEEPHPVDWDLWQSVVYEGPSAVHKTSGEELNRAIATGIPAAIRGVVWQVLAESKSEELENMYRTLKARGSEPAENGRPAPLSRTESHSTVNGTGKESEVSSVRSSMISGHSTPATSNMASPPPSVHGDEADLRSKLLAEKQKRERDAMSKLEKAIKRDMGTRTSYSKFTQSAGLQDGLFGVCKAYALFDETVGYAQGINFIAMPLLFNMSEEESFTLLVRLMNKYEVRSLFMPEMPGLHLRLYQFERLLEDHDPALYCHLRRRNVEPKLYATQWFLTLFAYRFPLQLVLRVYDLIFSEGLTAIIKFGLVLMQHNRDALLAMKDMQHLTTFLKDKLFDAYIDKSPSASSLLDSGFFGSVSGGADKELYRADEMVRDAAAIRIPDATLAAYTQEWEDIQRKDREHLEQMETLRAANAALISKNRELEDRLQAQDAEHVTLAGDIVKYKLENDTLADENEGLRHKSNELQGIVDAQPAEVEEKVREEMQSILTKNEQVGGENRRLKESVDDMEEQLVNAKMHAAHIQTEYDDLQQKWSNLQGLLSGSGSPRSGSAGGKSR